jgi:hypothetical protein
MYYYIFEPPLEAKDYERSAQIKEYLSSLGIAGEMTTPSFGKDIPELVRLAVSKRYSTIIAVGGPATINQVARAIAPYDLVFGIVPAREHPDLSRLVGAPDWKGAAEALKRRLVTPVRLGLINGQLGFLTPATIDTKGTTFTITTPDFSFSDVDGIIRLTPAASSEVEGSLLVEIDYRKETRGLLGGIFSRGPSAPRYSRFVTTQAEIFSLDPCTVEVAGTEICSTPILCQTQEKPIRMIMGKGN